MLIIWKVRVFNRSEREWSDRSLVLLTDTLQALDRAAVELICESRRPNSREILKYRSCFQERNLQDEDLQNAKSFRTIGIEDYFEDEVGNEIPFSELGPLLSGNPNSVLFPAGAKPHDIQFYFARQVPIDWQAIEIEDKQLKQLAYFVRDLSELSSSTFMRDGSGSITIEGIDFQSQDDGKLRTGVTDTEIRSFVTVFRRLYMSKEPSNFVKTARSMASFLVQHGMGHWIQASVEDYESVLQSPPSINMGTNGPVLKFTVKRLIDVFLYTQFAHQPETKRERQYLECLAEIDGRKNLLTWYFLSELFCLCLKIQNVGRVIARCFESYCSIHQVSPAFLDSLIHLHPDIGGSETQQAKRERLFNEKVDSLAKELWIAEGRPENGPSEFLETARIQLMQKLS